MRGLHMCFQDAAPEPGGGNVRCGVLEGRLDEGTWGVSVTHKGGIEFGSPRGSTSESAIPSLSRCSEKTHVGVSLALSPAALSPYRSQSFLCHLYLGPGGSDIRAGGTDRVRAEEVRGSEFHTLVGEEAQASESLGTG